MKAMVVGSAVAAWAALGVGVGVVTSGCISPVIPIGGGKSASQNQQALLAREVPADLTVAGAWRGEIRTARVRVWADDDYRAQNSRWRHSFDEQLEMAGQVLGPMLGIRLEADYRTWERHSANGSLDDALTALASLDPGDDVVWVIGLTSSLTLVSPTFDHLGLAELNGRHIIVRGHADVEERKAYERAFPDLDAHDRAQVLEARRRHKTTAVLVHELGHGLGALHELVPASLMNATYSHANATIGAGNRELMLLAIEDRLKPAAARDPVGTAKQQLALLERGASGWVDADRTSALTALRGQLSSAPSSADSGTPSAGLPADVIAEANRAAQLLAAKRAPDARAALEPLIAAYPAHAELRLLACRVAIVEHGATDARARAVCGRAAGSHGAAAPALAVAAEQRTRGDLEGARATVAALEARLTEVPADRAATEWLMVAEFHRALGEISHAERAIERVRAAAPAKDDAGRQREIAALTGWAATTRARYGIPRDGARWKLTPDDEADALVAVRRVLASVNEGAFDRATREARALERRWPALPGVLAARCDLEYRRRSLAAARQLCDRAIADGGSSWAMYLRGVMALREPGAGAVDAGIAHLRRAIASDPKLAQAWRALAAALLQRKATAELDQLRADYQKEFGARLPG